MLCIPPLKCVQLGPGAQKTCWLPSQLICNPLPHPEPAASSCGPGLRSVSLSDLIMTTAWPEQLLAFSLGPKQCLCLHALQPQGFLLIPS